MPKVVITGAGGYIGGRLVDALLDVGDDVHVIVRRPTPRLGVPETVVDLAHDAAPERLADAFSGADCVVHLAGENELLAAEAPAAALASTVVATERLGEACAQAGVRRVVYMSTVHVYGARMEPGAKLEEDMRVEPRSAYAISRLASEHVAASLAEGHCELVVLRLTNSVGAPSHPEVNRWSLVTNDLCRQGALTGELRLRSSGSQWRDFVPLADVCRGLIRARSTGEGSIPPGTYNLASGESTTVRALAAVVQDAFQAATGRRPPLHAPSPELNPPGPYSVANRRAQDGGIEMQSTLAEAVAETAQFCLLNRDSLPL